MEKTVFETVRSLRRVHRRTKDKKLAYRTNAVILLKLGDTLEQVARALLIDGKTVRNRRDACEKGGAEALEKKAERPLKLSPEQIERLKQELSANLCPTAAAIRAYVKKEFGVKYAAPGMVVLLHRIGFSYKKTKRVPSKADREKQEAFVKEYGKLRKKGEKVYFTDGVRPAHSATPGNGWIPKGEERGCETNTGRRRANANGAYSPDGEEVLFREDDSVNAQSAVKLLKKIEKANAGLEKAYAVCDDARYCRSKLVKEYLEGSRIELLFLPPCSPNLNLIERLWKKMKKDVMRNRYYEAFDDFRKAILNYLKNKSGKRKREYAKLMTEKFHFFPQTVFS